MTTTRLPEIRDGSLTHDLLSAGRYYLGGRRGLLVLAAVAFAAGLWLGWPTLVAAGIAPILIALAPCAVMCALGLCMGRMGKPTAASPSSDTDAPALSRRTLGPDAQDAALPAADAGCALCEGATDSRTPHPMTAQIPQAQKEKTP